MPSKRTYLVAGIVGLFALSRSGSDGQNGSNGDGGTGDSATVKIRRTNLSDPTLSAYTVVAQGTPDDVSGSYDRTTIETFSTPNAQFVRVTGSIDRDPHTYQIPTPIDEIIVDPGLQVLVDGEPVPVTVR